MRPRPEHVAVFHSELKAATQGAHYEICPGEQDNGLYFMTKDIVINEGGYLLDFKSNSYVWITGAAVKGERNSTRLCTMRMRNLLTTPTFGTSQWLTMISRQKNGSFIRNH